MAANCERCRQGNAAAATWSRQARFGAVGELDQGDRRQTRAASVAPSTSSRWRRTCALRRARRSAISGAAPAWRRDRRALAKGSAVVREMTQCAATAAVRGRSTVAAAYDPRMRFPDFGTELVAARRRGRRPLASDVTNHQKSPDALKPTSRRPLSQRSRSRRTAAAGRHRTPEIRPSRQRRRRRGERLHLRASDSQRVFEDRLELERANGPGVAPPHHGVQLFWSDSGVTVT